MGANLKIHKLNSRGMALVTVIIVMLVLTILTTGIIVISVANFRQTNTTVEHNQAYYVAEAGVNYQVRMFEKKVDEAIALGYKATQILEYVDAYLDLNGSYTQDFVTGDGVSTFSTTMSRSMNHMVIESTGVVGNESRTLTKLIRMPGLIIDKAIMTQGILEVNATDVFYEAPGVPGPIQSLLVLTPEQIEDGEKVIVIKTNGFVSKVYIRTPPAGYSFADVIGGCTQIGPVEDMRCQTGSFQYEVVYDDSIVFPPFILNTPPSVDSDDLLQPYTMPSKTSQLVNSTGNITINANTVTSGIYSIAGGMNGTKTQFYVPSFRVESTVAGFTIDVGDEDIELKVGSMYLAGEFKITGNGSLTVYVDRSNLVLSCKNKVCGVRGYPNEKEADSFILIVRDNDGGLLDLTQDFTSGSNQVTFYMSLMTDADINITLSGNGHFYGFIAALSEDITFNGKSSGKDTTKSSALIYAPNADIVVNGAVNLEGALIGNTYLSNGNAEMTFNGDFVDAPFDFLNPFSSFEYGPTIED